MQIETPLHAEHQLDQLAGQFEHWRQTRTHSSERFPQALWDHAVALASVLPPPRVAKQLRLRLTDLKKQMPAATSACGAPQVPGLCGSARCPLLASAHGRAPYRALPRRRHPAVHPRCRVDSAACTVGAGLSGGALMLQLTPQSRIFVATQPVDCRKGIDGLAAVCRQALGDNPLGAPSTSFATVRARR